jgi:hypothetical protein
MFRRNINLRLIAILAASVLLLLFLFIAISTSIRSVDSQQSAERIKSICKLLTTLGICLTTGLSVYSLSRKTAKEPEDSNVKELTPEGKKYLKALLFSSVLTITVSFAEAKADKVLNKLHEDESQQALISKLNPLMKAMLNSMDQAINQETKKIGTALQSVNDDVNNTNRDVNILRDNVVTSSNNLTARVRHSSGEQRFANQKVTGLLIYLYVPDIKTETNQKRDKIRSRIERQLRKNEYDKCAPVFAAGKDKEGWEDVPLSDRLAAVSFIQRLECGSAKTKSSNWEQTYNLFGYMDPKNHMQIGFNFILSGFSGGVSRDYRSNDIYLTFLNTNRQFLKEVEKLHGPYSGDLDKYPSLPRVGDGAPQPGLAFTVNNDNAEFGGATRLGQETDLMTLSAYECDDHLSSETNAEMMSHLKTFPSNKSLALEIIFTNESGDVFRKPYILKPNLPTFEPSVGGQCLKITYDLY